MIAGSLPAAAKPVHTNAMTRRDNTATAKPPPIRNRAGSRARDIVPKPRAERLLRVGEVARLLNVSRRTVYRLIRRGDLPSILVVSRLVRVRAADLEKYLRLHRLRALRLRSSASKGSAL